MRKLREGIKGNILKIILLMVFSLYTCSISFFTHTHIIEGVTIVHSHFYGTDEQGKPTHEHSGAEVQLIHNLITYFSLATVIAFILIGLLNAPVITLFSKCDFLSKEEAYQRQLRLRAPPVL